MKHLVALLPVLIAFQAGAPPALAWTWPADGPVLGPFILGDNPYAGGQHRGVDIAGEAGAPVRSPAAGVVSFAGTVPGGGRSVTVQTADGHSVTLIHLGSIAVAPDDTRPRGRARRNDRPDGRRRARRAVRAPRCQGDGGCEGVSRPAVLPSRPRVASPAVDTTCGPHPGGPAGRRSGVAASDARGARPGSPGSCSRVARAGARAAGGPRRGPSRRQR